MKALLARSAVVVLWLGIWSFEDTQAASVKAWKTADQEQIEVSHDAWHSVLARYLSENKEINLFDYAKVGAEDRLLLDRYIKTLAQTEVDLLTRAQQMAFWINLYNALTVQVILDHWPVESIKEIRSGMFKPGPWDLPLLEVDGVELSLNDIEHRILRPTYQDPRIHFAVNCASFSCPDLASEPYLASNLESMLEAATRKYLSHSRGLNLAANELLLSSIFKWYRKDFAHSEQGLLDYLANYTAADISKRLKRWNGPINYRYDWSLNAP